MYVYTYGTFNLSGAPTITGNIGNGWSNNVYLCDEETITITGQLTKGAQIGVTTESDPTDDNQVDFADGEGISGADAVEHYVNKLKSDKAGYGVRKASEGHGLALANGVLKGKSDTILDPSGPATRAEAAIMLRNFMAMNTR